MRQNTPDYRQGDVPLIKTIFLLSAPGKMEESAGRPAAGETGRTLDMALEILHEKNADAFPSLRLDDYTIANSVAEIHYKAKTGRTEATDNEIFDRANIERLNNILSNSQSVVALGNKAYLAVTASNYTGVVVKANHPSLQALNSKYKSVKKTPQERRTDRIIQWACDINLSLGLKKENL